MKKLKLSLFLTFLLLLLFSCNNPIQVNDSLSEVSIDRAVYSATLDPLNGLGDVQGLGVYYTSTSSRFSIWSPDSNNVLLVLNGIEYNVLLDSTVPYTDIYSVIIPGDHQLEEYYYKINNIAVRDPYGIMVKPGENINIVMDLNQTDPDDGWVGSPLLNEREDAIIYEVHIRDFTLDSSSGVTDAIKGKFPGMVETGTTYNGYSTGIDHLKELGINTVQILPFYDFGTQQYNWGYDPVNYNVPEEQYSADPYDYSNRIKELKTMINEFHKNGIRVVMDVVYNHTFNNEMFENISNRYYTGTDLSGCGNALDTSEVMVSKMILDSLDYWINEYNIDGFRFDLVGIFQYDVVNDWGIELNSKYPDRNLLLYGEPWNGGVTDVDENTKVRLGNVPAMSGGHVGVFNPKYRDAVKGSTNGTDGAYIFNNGVGNDIRMGSRGGILYSYSTNTLPNLWDPMYAYDPEQTITYISAHDNLNLWDKIKHVGITGEYAERIDMFGSAMVLTSQGISFIQAGDEFLRTKVYNGDWTYAENSYNAPDEYNKIYWNLKEDNNLIFNYYKDLIALRKEHPGFRMNTWSEINDYVTTNVINDQIIVTQIDSDKNGDLWDDIIVIYNSGNSYTYTLPVGNWEVVVEEVSGNISRIVSGTVSIAGTAITVLHKLNNGSNNLIINYQEYEYATSYILHAWDGLTGDFTMTYDGLYDSSNWWTITIPDAPDLFSFCFTNSNGTWDGINRLYNLQSSEIYIKPNDSTIYTIRP
ncbi:MAG: alpha-amylase family glycosyl hydrolase [Spirochaetaceae bacterium]|jgi:pullulanase|nr:alpha-amylase family glycosyl hydrolase [Spirochaetaceae bacterium]